MCPEDADVHTVLGVLYNLSNGIMTCNFPYIQIKLLFSYMSWWKSSQVQTQQYIHLTINNSACTHIFCTNRFGIEIRSSYTNFDVFILDFGDEELYEEESSVK